MKISEPLITIGITCFNEGDWLLECWQSVLEQTDDRWEAVLVMDGGASDRTRDIFESLEHYRLRKHLMPTNIGPYPVRNKAFELTRTPYHFYLDGDDQLLPNSVELVLNAFMEHPNVGIVYGDYVFFGSHSGKSNSQRVITAESFLKSQPIPGGCAYKKEVWEKLGGFATELARGNADYDFHIGAFEQNVLSYHLGDVFYKNRIGLNKRVSYSYKLRYYKSARIIVNRHKSFFSLRQRCKFMAQAYQTTAIANARAGKKLKAFHWALISMLHGNIFSKKNWNLFGRPGNIIFQLLQSINCLLPEKRLEHD